MANTLKFGNGEWYGKKDTILAYNDENSNYKPLPFDFSRASSATVINKDGLIETVGSDMPRIDYKDDSEGALLLEPQRTNLIQYSNLKSGWDLLSGGSIAYNQAVSPEGIQNASILSGDGINGNSIYDAINLSLQSHTLSVFAKQKGASVISFEGFTSGALGISKFNLSNGTIATNSSNQFSDEKIEDYGNGWYRCSVKLTPTSSGIKFLGFRGENSDSGELFSLYGAQLEEGSYATSYIPTQGSAVTRLADSCSQTAPDSVIGQTEGVLYCDFTIKNNPTSTRRVIVMSNGTASERIGISLGNGIMYAFIVYGNNTQCEIIKSSVTLGNYKCAFAYNNNDFAFYVNGLQVGIDTSGTVASCNRIDIGNQFNVSFLEGYVQETKLYNTRLSNSELQALTS